MHKVAVVIPNLNGAESLKECLDSLLRQSIKAEIIVVENGSTDESSALLENYAQVTILPQVKNLGFAGGVNVGIRHAIENGCEYIALLNNDAVADKNWLKELVASLDTNPEAGIATCTFMTIEGDHLDSTGDMFTNWGLPFPRGRGEAVKGQYDGQANVFGASGGASIYRVSMLQEIGLFDEDFFAYYEDVDISFRAQLAGWKVLYVPEAKAYHQIGATSGKMKGFTTYQTMKNQPLVIFKNVPRKYLWRITWRHTLAHTLFFLRAISRGQGWFALKGDTRGTLLLFKNIGVRRRIQKSRKVSDEYIWSIITHDLPPNAHALRSLRAKFWKLRGKRA